MLWLPEQIKGLRLENKQTPHREACGIRSVPQWRGEGSPRLLSRGSQHLEAFPAAAVGSRAEPHYKPALPSQCPVTHVLVNP